MDFAAVDIMTLNETFGKKVRIPFATEVKIPFFSLPLIPIKIRMKVWQSMKLHLILDPFVKWALYQMKLGNNYTTAHMYSSAGFEYFVKSEFEWEPLMVDKQIIPHLKALYVASKIYQ